MMMKTMGWAGVIILLIAIWKHGVGVPHLSDYEPLDPKNSQVMTSTIPTVAARISATASNYTVNDEPWDGISGVGGAAVGIFASTGFVTPPDLALCIGVGSNAPACETIERDGQATSHCVNSVSCDWQVEIPEGQPFSILLFDIDDGLWEGPYDFVDAMYVAEADQTQELESLDTVARAYIEQLAPTEISRPDFIPPGPAIQFNEGEKQRREAPFTYISRTALSDGFQLTQSSIRLIIQ